MGIQTVPFSIRVREHTRPQEPHVYDKHCKRQLREAIEHPLPQEAQTLKLKILETHPIKTTRFSLSHMKRLAIPPVEVPRGLRGPVVMTSIVAGKKVPYSRDMWENRKRKANRTRLDAVYEFVEYK